MKKISGFVFCFSLLFALLLFASCKRSNSSPSSTSSFTWKYRDTTYTAASQKAYISSMATHPIIVASKRSPVNSGNFNIGITVSSFNSGTYNIGSSNANTFVYIDNVGDMLNGPTGTVTITSYSNNLLSGNFSATINSVSGASHIITGTFINVPVEQ